MNPPSPKRWRYFVTHHRVSHRMTLARRRVILWPRFGRKRQFSGHRMAVTARSTILWRTRKRAVPFQKRLPARLRAACHNNRTGSSAIAPMRPHELLAATTFAPLGANKHGRAIRTLYAEQDRYLYAHKLIHISRVKTKERFLLSTYPT